MKKKYKILLLTAALLLLTFAAYRIFTGNSDEEKIRKTLHRLTTLAAKPQEPRPAELAAKLRTLQTIFAEQVTIDFGARKMSETYTPRSLEPLLVNFRKQFISSDCSMSDLETTVSGGHADTVFACRFQGTPRKGNAVDEVRDINCRLVKHDKTWYIESISINDILER